MIARLLKGHPELLAKETQINLAAIGSYTLNSLKDPLWLSLLGKGLCANVTIGEYNQYVQEILDPNSPIRKSDPDILLVLLDAETFLEGLLGTLRSQEDLLKAADVKMAYLKTLLSEAKKSMKAHVILSNLVIPYYSPLGLRDANAQESVRGFVAQINGRIRALSQEFDNVTILDVDGFASYHGKRNLTSDRYWYVGRLYVSNELSYLFAQEISHIIASYYGKAKKCLVVDLDNTLWGGVIGEEFVEGIRLGEGDPIGEAHAEIQRIILNFRQNGVILAINSKNNPEDANLAFTHKGMILRKEDFASIKCNWNDKALNIVEIAKELNIGLDSMAYLDDNPAERASMRHKLSQVHVIDFPEDITEVPRALKELRIFDLLTVGKEDTERTKMYLEEKKRESLKENFSNLTDYLYDLQMELTISSLNEGNIDRIAQLINKTNQFNLRTKRYTKEQVALFGKSSAHRVYAASLKDKFGEFGIIGALIFENKGDFWFIDTFLLSCRAMSRGVEKEFLRKTIGLLPGPALISGEYLKTPKNAPVENLYRDLGFEHKEGQWRLNGKEKPLQRVEWMKVKIDG